MSESTPTLRYFSTCLQCEMTYTLHFLVLFCYYLLLLNYNYLVALFVLLAFLFFFVDVDDVLFCLYSFNMNRYTYNRCY